MIEVHSLWIGNSLSQLEVLSIRSHLSVGHRYHLWTYEGIRGVPDGVVVEEGRKILPAEDIFCYQVGEGKGSFSAFSNLFRYKLLAERGGWWCDTDVVALKPFDFAEDFVFASERTRYGYSAPTTCVIKMPQGHEVAKGCYLRSCLPDRSKVQWGTIGPKLLGGMVHDFPLRDLNEFVMPPHVFCPVNWFDVEYDPPCHAEVDLSKSHAVHLWQEMWRRRGLDKDGTYSPDCLFERLKAKYAVLPVEASGRLPEPELAALDGATQHDTGERPHPQLPPPDGPCR